MNGYILSNTNVLSAKESSYCLIAGLIPLDVNMQLKGHLQGALNNGASVEEIRAVRDVVVRICEVAGMERLGEATVNGWGWGGGGCESVRADGWAFWWDIEKLSVFGIGGIDSNMCAHKSQARGRKARSIADTTLELMGY